MLPPSIADKFASPLVRYGGIAIVGVLVFGWGYLKGSADVKQAWDASVAKQAAEVSQQVMKQATVSQQVLNDHANTEQQARERIKIVEKEVIKYVQSPNKPCVLEPPLVERFDAVSRVLTDEDRVPAADGRPRVVTESSGAVVAGTESVRSGEEVAITTHEALQAYHAAVEQLAMLWVDYAALVQWERGRYIVEKSWFEP